MELEFSKPTDKPDLLAWRKTTASGETTTVILGKFWNSPNRIEADPEDLMTDPDALPQEP